MDTSASGSAQPSSNSSGSSLSWKNVQNSVYNYFFPSEKKSDDNQLAGTTTNNNFEGSSPSDIQMTPNKISDFQQPADASSSSNASQNAVSNTEQQQSADTSKAASSTLVEETLAYDNFIREYRTIMQQEPFEGLRVELQLPFNKYMGITHSLFVKNQTEMDRLSYQFGPTFASEDGSSNLMARIGNDGMVFASGQKKLGPYSMKMSSYSFFGNPHANVSDFCIDRYGIKNTASLKLGWRGMLTMSAALSYSLQKNLQIGGEFTYALLGLPGIYSLGARYTNGSHIFTGKVGTQNLPFRRDIVPFYRLQYVRNVSDRCSFCTEWEFLNKNMESGLRVGWIYMFKQAIVQGLVDSGGKICMFSQDMQSGSGVSALLDYFNGDYRFGVLKTISPVPPQEQEIRENK